MWFLRIAEDVAPANVVRGAILRIAEELSNVVPVVPANRRGAI